MIDFDSIWRTQDEIRTVVNAVLGEHIWNLAYGSLADGPDRLGQFGAGVHQRLGGAGSQQECLSVLAKP